ncbi:MAG: hypothetical protein IIA17_10655, partial [candidate division Zixibacteria bacterium]|nr:hypothetical protein [candidate division Zixibacteria bacterium]
MVKLTQYKCISGRMSKTFLCSFLIAICFACPTVNAARTAKVQAALNQLRQENPGLRTSESNGEITRIFGKSFGSSTSPVATAEDFRVNYAQVFGLEPSDLKPTYKAGTSDNTQGIMYDRSSGTYKFTLIKYSQFQSSIPVFRSQLKLLVRNESDYPLVMASSSLRDLGKYQVDPEVVNIDKNGVISSFKDP